VEDKRGNKKEKEGRNSGKKRNREGERGGKGLEEKETRRKRKCVERRPGGTKFDEPFLGRTNMFYVKISGGDTVRGRGEARCPFFICYACLPSLVCTLMGLDFGEQWFLSGDDRFKTDDAEREISQRGDTEWRSMTRSNPCMFLLPGRSRAFENGRCGAR